MADRRRIGPRPATTSEVVAEVWDRRDLSGETHRQVLFSDVDLTEATGTGAVFEECTFREVEFNAATFADSAFTNCTFVRCSFFGATFSRCKLVGSLFDRCRFGAMKVEGGDWSFVGLAAADLRNATLDRVRLREVDLSEARLDKAVLTGGDLSGASLHQANLTECDLRGTELSGIDPATTNVRGAIVDTDQAVVLAQSLGFDVRPLWSGPHGPSRAGPPRV